MKRFFIGLLASTIALSALAADAQTVGSVPIPTPVPPAQGGTGGNNSSATGVGQWNAGAYTPSAALANGVTATTQSTSDSSTKLATDAYVNNVLAAPPAIGATTANAVTGSSMTDTGINGSTQCVQANSSGLFSGAGKGCDVAGAALGGTSAASPSGPGSTSSYTMMGLGYTITPVRSGNLFLSICGSWHSGSATAAGDGASIYITYGTGAAPSNGVAVTGTAATGAAQLELGASVTAANYAQPYCVQGVVTGLTVNTAYWFDLAAKAIGATGFSPTVTTGYAIEAP
jgi:hypothetical protein